MSVQERRLAAVAGAIFAKLNPFVVEAYSTYDAKPVHFHSQDALLSYGEAHSRLPRGTVHLAVHYPDMQGRAVLKRIELNRAKCSGHSFRYTHEGWGLLWVHLEMAEETPTGSFVSANSKRRAENWAGTNTAIDPPGAWNWQAVGAHLRRLRLALRKAV